MVTKASVTVLSRRNEGSARCVRRAAAKAVSTTPPARRTSSANRMVARTRPRNCARVHIQIALIAAGRTPLFGRVARQGHPVHDPPVAGVVGNGVVLGTAVV